MQSLGLIKAPLRGFSVLITGGGSGIGLSTAELFAEMNANVAINYLPSDKESIKRINLLSKKFSNIQAFPGDISNAEIAERVVLQTYKKFKSLNFLINNVGIGLVKNPIPFDKLNMIDDKFWKQIMQVNLMSAFYCSRASAKYLKEKKGAIVNVTSISSSGKRGTSIPYAVSKGSLNTLTRSLAKSLAPDVRVNAVSPGFTITNMTKQRTKSHKEKMAKQTLLKRNAKPKEIAEIIFMLCVSGSFVTGEIINVDGGHGYIY